MSSRRTRRSLLGQVLAAAGLLGAGAAESVAANVPDSGATELTLRTRKLRMSGHGAADAPERGERLTASAELTDESGATAGSFHATAFALRGPGASGDGADSLELHTFDLNDGSIIGSGAAGRLEGSFAVLGGTGRYNGARGSYLISRDDYEYDGGGAEFVLTLTA